MIESKLFLNLQESFERFKKEIKQDGEFKEKIIYYYDLALENIRQNHQEVAILLLCTIIESFLYKKYKIEHKEFFDWLKTRESFEEFSKEFLEEENKKAVLEKWKEKYLEDYGITRKFVKIVMDCYKNQKGIPNYILDWKTEMINGIKTSTLRNPEEEINEEELYNDFEKDLKKIYREYRSKFVHQGEFIPFDSRISTQIGGISHPQCISSQQFAGIVLVVMKDFFNNQSAKPTNCPKDAPSQK